MKALKIKILTIIMISVLCGSALASESAPDDYPSTTNKFVKLELRDEFEKYKVDGGLTIFSDGYSHSYNLRVLEQAYLPASTFKIANSLIALQTGVIQDIETTLPWDSVDRGWSKWNMDHNLRSGMEYSAVWFYQELARRIGPERMQLWVDSLGYGNKDISGGIDQFWLNGGLRISPYEQIHFLQRLFENKLPVDTAVMESVKEIMILEKTDQHTLRGKTGWARDVDPEVGWFVGWVENSQGVHYFATLILSKEDAGASFKKARQEITLKVLRDLGILPKVEDR